MVRYLRECDVRRQATLVDDIKKKKLTSRDDLGTRPQSHRMFFCGHLAALQHRGLPLPPTDLKLKAIAKIQRSTATQASKCDPQDAAFLTGPCRFLLGCAGKKQTK